MASKQSKHQATTGSQSKDGIRKPVRLTILAIIYTLFLAAAIAFHAQEGVQRLMEGPRAHLHMVAVFSAVPGLPQKAFVVSRCRRTHRAAAVDRHTAGNRLFSRRGHVPDHRHHHHVDHHRTQPENRHSSRRNNTCANSINQNTICEYFSRTVDYYQPAFCQCCI